MNKSITRRSFLGAAGLGLAGPLLLPARARGANERITLGLIGSGSRGTHVMMDGFIANKEVSVLAVCDVMQERREKAAALVDDFYEQKGCAQYADFREVLARDDIDAVIIAPQDHWHAVMATMAAKAGKDMYCEKPLGVSVKECQAVRDAARRHKVVFQTGTQQRSDKNFRRACELARSGLLGTIHTIEVAVPGPHYLPKYDGSPEPQPVPAGLDWEMFCGPAPLTHYNPGRMDWPDWYLIWDYCAGFIVNWGVHHLDVALWGCPRLMTQPFELTCTADYRTKGFSDNINGWQAEFVYPDGLRMQYSDTDHPYRQGCCFRGDAGWVHVNRKGIEAEPASLLEAPLPDGAERLYESAHHARDFIQAVKSRKDPVSTVEAGCQASYLGMLGDIAARLNRKVRWDPVAERFLDDDEEASKMLQRPLRAPWAI